MFAHKSAPLTFMPAHLAKPQSFDNAFIVEMSQQWQWTHF
jgi:hypothetical protein